MRLRVVVAATLACLPVASTASASVRIGPDKVVVTARSGARAVIDRAPFRLRFENARGHAVLSEVSGGGDTLVEPPYPENEFGRIGPAAPALYAPLGFVVGAHHVNQTPAGQWIGTLQSVVQGGIAYSARRVESVTAAGGGARLMLETSDPSGRQLSVTVTPYRRDALRVSARPTPVDGVATMADSFQSTPGEAFHGFGGRHAAIDQRGDAFYSWLEQENVDAGRAGRMPGAAGRRPLAVPQRARRPPTTCSRSFVSSRRLRLPPRPRRAVALAPGARDRPTPGRSTSPRRGARLRRRAGRAPRARSGR